MRECRIATGWRLYGKEEIEKEGKLGMEAYRARCETENRKEIRRENQW